MKEIVIYVEGGGDTAQQKAELRQGLDRLLGEVKQAARDRRLGWKLVPSGGRAATYKAFMNAVAHGRAGTVHILLVDSEGPLTPESLPPPDEPPAAREARERANAMVRREHLQRRGGWNLADISPEQIHLMVQCMETWLVADPDGLARYYGQGFHVRSLPIRRDLEEEPKAALHAKLAAATKETRSGAYSEANHAKIKHASRILSMISAEAVKLRCPRFATLTRWLTTRIQEA